MAQRGARELLANAVATNMAARWRGLRLWSGVYTLLGAVTAPLAACSTAPSTEGMPNALNGGGAVAGATTTVGAAGTLTAPNALGATAGNGMGGAPLGVPSTGGMPAGAGGMPFTPDASAGSLGLGGVAGIGGATGIAGAASGAGGLSPVGGSAGQAGGGQGGAQGAAGAAPIPEEKFSFFVTSLTAMRQLSGNPMGFGGDLRYGEATGLAGADKICREIAESSLAGSGQKGWHAFLSTVAGGPDGGPVHAIDRLGDGPWYDRLERLIAASKADLIHDRPTGTDAVIINDFPNETGTPNHEDPTDFEGATGCTEDCPETQHDVECAEDCPDNHDVLTGTGPDGMLHSTDPTSTCDDWTSASDEEPMPEEEQGGFGAGGPWCGHSWPRNGSGLNWMSALAEGGCGPGVNLAEGGGPERGVYTVGTGGGYGAIYCFADIP